MPKVKLTIKAEELKKKLGLKDGYTPIKGKDYFDGPKGDKGKDAEPVNTAKIIAESVKQAQEAILPKIPTIPQVTEQIPLEAERVRDALEVLVGDERLDASAIANLPQVTEKVIERIGGAGRGMNIYVEGNKKGLIKTIDFIGATYSKENGRDTLTFEGDGSSNQLPATINRTGGKITSIVFQNKTISFSRYSDRLVATNGTKTITFNKVGGKITSIT